jgi:malonyl-CoA O-methyltransferase
MKVSLEFSRYADSYDKHNVIQEKVAQKVISLVRGEPQSILDLGCGRGALVKKIDWKYQKFVGVDFAKGMVALHPKGENIECIYGDFNDKKLFETLACEEFDYILSSSALQWAENLEEVFLQISKLDTPIVLALFTANTFKTLHATANIDSPLPKKEEIFDLQKKYFQVDCEVVTYTLEFQNSQDIFRYIKESGVSGGRNLLGFKQMKALMKNYPNNQLEFEVVFLWS